MDDEVKSFNALGFIMIFSFFSTITLFFAMLLFAVINNYALSKLYSLVGEFASNNIIPASFPSISDTIVSSIPLFLPSLDYIWFGAFVSMVVSTLLYSYNSERVSYFNLFIMLTLGLILFMFIGSYFVDMTNWFLIEIVYRVLPTFSTYTPIFSWYLDNLAVINISLIVLNIIANFVDLDFSKFFNRKGGGSIDEI